MMRTENPKHPYRAVIKFESYEGYIDKAKDVLTRHLGLGHSLYLHLFGGKIVEMHRDDKTTEDLYQHFLAYSGVEHTEDVRRAYYHGHGDNTPEELEQK